MTTQTRNLSRLMRISWDIQRRRSTTRSKALRAAWAIFSNEDITISYLTRRLNHDKPVKERNQRQLALFAQ